MSFKKICTFIIMLPVAVILVAFIVANRAVVPLNLDIFSALFGKTGEGYTLSAPLFIWLFAFLLLGLFIGIVMFAPKLYKIRRRHHQLVAENIRLNKKLLAHKPQPAKDYLSDVTL